MRFFNQRSSLIIEILHFLILDYPQLLLYHNYILPKVIILQTDSGCFQLQLTKIIDYRAFCVYYKKTGYYYETCIQKNITKNSIPYSLLLDYSLSLLLLYIAYILPRVKIEMQWLFFNHRYPNHNEPIQWTISIRSNVCECFKFYSKIFVVHRVYTTVTLTVVLYLPLHHSCQAHTGLRRLCR